MLFSIIIPCHNSKTESIKNLMHSLTKQGIDKDDLQVIIVDDNSSDKSYLDICKTFEDELNVEYYHTDTDIHCPGNTRIEGMKHVKGGWLCFCDHDDYYEDNALKQIKIYTGNLDHTVYVISTIMHSVDPETHDYVDEFAHKSAWLHGKFFNYNKLIKPYNINFKKDLVTHEDIYFNSSVLNVLFQLNTDLDYLDINTYCWVNDEESITRTIRNDRGYLYENFEDYIICAAEPFMDMAIKTHRIEYVNQIMMTLLHSYFYYEAAVFNEGQAEYSDVLEIIRKFVKNIQNNLGYSLSDIVGFIYADVVKYYVVKGDCEICVGKFISSKSFKDFIYDM